MSDNAELIAEARNVADDFELVHPKSLTSGLLRRLADALENARTTLDYDLEDVRKLEADGEPLPEGWSVIDDRKLTEPKPDYRYVSPHEKRKHDEVMARYFGAEA